MEIMQNKNGSSLELVLEGRLDTTTAPKFEEVITESLEGIDDLVLDFKSLEYISSAGLRVLLAAQKKMNTQGKMVIRNVNSDINDIFEITGFSSILNIE